MGPKQPRRKSSQPKNNGGKGKRKSKHESVTDDDAKFSDDNNSIKSENKSRTKSRRVKKKKRNGGGASHDNLMGTDGQSALGELTFFIGDASSLSSSSSLSMTNQSEADKKFFEDLASIFLFPLGTLDENEEENIFPSGSESLSPSPPRKKGKDASWAKVTKKGKHVNKTPEQQALEERIKEAEREIKEYKEHNVLEFENQDTRTRILLLDAPIHVKVTLLNKYDEMNKKTSQSLFGGGGGSSGDKSKFNQWINDVLKLPFSQSRPLPVKLEDGPQKIKEYLTNAKDQLDKAIWGHDHAKDEIIDYIARIVSNPEGKGSVLALSGNKGTGKTRLIKQGVSKALGRPFHVINLAGASDVHTLVGHSSTYVGAKPGKLAEIMMMSKCNNPVIYLDEIDKVESKSEKGMEVFRMLTHMLDPEQNYEFYDEYFDNVPIDLSKVLFVASMNNPEDIEPILRDRLKIVYLNPLTRQEKLKIAYDYILPELCASTAIKPEDLDIPEDVMGVLIDHGATTGPAQGEDGCRQMKRNIETVLQRLNRQRITTTVPDQKEKTKLTKEMVQEMLKNATVPQNSEFAFMYT